MRRRLTAAREAIASRLWPVPLAAVVLAVALGVVLPIVDRKIDDDLPVIVAGFIFSGGVDAARAVLSAVAGSLITAASLTFSLTVVALQLASSQASPRLLRMFSSDPMVHATLGLFLGTFAYSLTVLRTVEDATGDADEFVPRLAVTVATLLALASVVLLTFFLAHLARELRVETMMRDVHREASRTIARMAAAQPGTPVASDAAISTAAYDARRVPAPASGFIIGVDREALVRVASEHDVVVRELRTIGSAVIEGTPLVEWWWASAAGDDVPDATRRIDERVIAAFSAGYERTANQDVGFGLRQLADVAAKALSPGVNDPTTAVHALGHIASLLGDLAAQDRPPAAYADDRGIVRLLPAADDFAALVEVGLQQVRRYGRDDPDVMRRLMDVIDDVGFRIRHAPDAAILAAQLDRIERTIEQADYDDHERAVFAARAADIRARIARATA